MKILFAVVLASLFAAGAASQEKKLKLTPVKPISGESGAANFKAYCASCHGMEGKGDGPAATALKAPPYDLASLSARNNGKFPADRLMSILYGKASISAHGVADMPVWGPVFQSFESEMEMRRRLHNIMEHIKTFQK